MNVTTVLGVGASLPNQLVRNDELTGRLDTTDEWITTRTGIKERRVAAKDEHTSDLAAKAALKAIEQFADLRLVDHQGRA